MVVVRMLKHSGKGWHTPLAEATTQPIIELLDPIRGLSIVVEGALKEGIKGD